LPADLPGIASGSVGHCGMIVFERGKRYLHFRCCPLSRANWNQQINSN